jgi:hypothetical protein
MNTFKNCSYTCFTNFYLVKYFIYRFLVRVSYLEIYNEEVRDLLGKDQTQRLEVRITEMGILPKAIECLLN